MNDFAYPAIVNKPTVEVDNPSYPLSMMFPNLSDELYGLLDFLGYRCAIIDDQFHLYLPTVEVLSKRWEEYRQLHKDQNLPPLKFISSQGIESDAAFIEAFFTADAIISEDIEAVHDHGIHVIPLLANVLTYKANYPIIREKMRDLIRQGCEQPLHLAKEAGLDLPYAELKAVEGAIVDTLLSLYPEQIRDTFEKSPFENAWAIQLIEKVETEFLFQVDSVENQWLTYFQTRFFGFDPKKVSQAWMVVQSRAILHKAHLLSDANIKALESHPDTANLSKAMLELLKEGLLTHRNFELLCQATPRSLILLHSALVNLKHKKPLLGFQFTTLLWSAASLGFIDIVDTLLRDPAAQRKDQLICNGKARAFQAALDNHQLECALRLLEDKDLLKYLDVNKVLQTAARSSMDPVIKRIFSTTGYHEANQVFSFLLEAARDPSLNPLIIAFLGSELSKGLTQGFVRQLTEAAEDSKNEELLRALEAGLQNSSKQN